MFPDVERVFSDEERMFPVEDLSMVYNPYGIYIEVLSLIHLYVHAFAIWSVLLGLLGSRIVSVGIMQQRLKEPMKRRNSQNVVKITPSLFAD